MNDVILKRIVLLESERYMGGETRRTEKKSARLYKINWNGPVNSLCYAINIREINN